MSPVAAAPVVTPASEPVMAQQPTTTATTTSSVEGLSVPPPAPVVESNPVVSAAPAAPAPAAHAPAAPTTAAAHKETTSPPASQGSAWQCYREARLSKVHTHDLSQRHERTHHHVPQPHIHTHRS